MLFHIVENVRHFKMVVILIWEIVCTYLKWVKYMDLKCENEILPPKIFWGKEKQFDAKGKSCDKMKLVKIKETFPMLLTLLYELTSEIAWD